MSLTNQDLQNIENIFDRKLDKLATKDDLKNFAIKDDLKNFATRGDLEKSESRIIAAMGLLRRDTFDRFENHEKRISRLEKLTD